MSPARWRWSLLARQVTAALGPTARLTISAPQLLAATRTRERRVHHLRLAKAQRLADRGDRDLARVGDRQAVAVGVDELPAAGHHLEKHAADLVGGGDQREGRVLVDGLDDLPWREHAVELGEERGQVIRAQSAGSGDAAGSAAERSRAATARG